MFAYLETLLHPFLKQLGIEVPIVQAPMAGVSTPEMAAAVCDSGGLGSIAIGAVDADTARQMIHSLRAKTNRPCNVNVFCHRPAVIDESQAARWLGRLRPEFARYDVQPPGQLKEIYQSFLTDDAKLAMLLAERPSVVSFHFGLPTPSQINALRSAGITLIATATNLAEATAAEAAGVDAIIAQGYEAGGHRGIFDPDSSDAQLGTFALVRFLVTRLNVPVLAAGGIMDGAGIAAALTVGAIAAQLGTAFIDCTESAADPAYRSALRGPGGEHTVMTSVISGRPARCLPNRFTAIGERTPLGDIPPYPFAYDAGKALHAAAKATGEFGYGAQWAGQGAPLARSLPTAQLMSQLRSELQEALRQGGRSRSSLPTILQHLENGAAKAL